MSLYFKGKDNQEEHAASDQEKRLPRAKPSIECLENMPSPRMEQTRRHELIGILVIIAIVGDPHSCDAVPACPGGFFF